MGISSSPCTSLRSFGCDYPYSSPNSLLSGDFRRSGFELIVSRDDQELGPARLLQKREANCAFDSKWLPIPPAILSAHRQAMAKYTQTKEARRMPPRSSAMFRTAIGSAHPDACVRHCHSKG